MIFYYKRFLYNEWFDSLSDKDKSKEEQRIIDLKAKREREGRGAWKHLGQIHSMVDRMSDGRMNDYIQAARDVSRITIHPSKYW